MDHFYLKLLLHFILPRKNVYHYRCSLPILSTSLITAAITLLCHCSYYTAVSALLCRGLIITSTMDCYSSHCPTLPYLPLPPLLRLHCSATVILMSAGIALLCRGLLFIRTIDCHYSQCQILLSLPLSPPLSPLLPLHCPTTVILIFAGSLCCAEAF